MQTDAAKCIPTRAQTIELYFLVFSIIKYVFPWISFVPIRRINCVVHGTRSGLLSLAWKSVLEIPFYCNHIQNVSRSLSHTLIHADNLLRAVFVVMWLTSSLDGRRLFSFSAWNLRSTLDNNWSKRPVGTQALNYRISWPKGHTQYA